MIRSGLTWLDWPRRSVRRWWRLGVALSWGVASIGHVTAAELPGWEAMRVIEQLGRPQVLKVVDLNGDGRDELLVVNSQLSRLDIYRWLPPADRTTEEKTWQAGPNDLPLAADLRREELQLEHVPQDVVVRRHASGQTELLILVSPPNQIVAYSYRDGAWHAGEKRLLPPGEMVPRHKSLLLRKVGGALEQLLVSYENGIVVMDLAEEGKVDWLAPRELRDRLDWWLADLDGDGDEDLLELCRESEESLRWYETVGSGHLSSAAVLFHEGLTGAAVLRSPGAKAQPLAIDGSGSGLLRRHELATTEQHALGNRRPLSLAGGNKAIWCGLQLGSSPALVAVDKDRPQLLVNVLERDGWQTEQTFPAVSDMMGLAPLAAEPGLLLIWAKDATQLLSSRWEEGRLTYPRPWTPSGVEAKGKLIGLGSIGETTWWAHLEGKDIRFTTSMGRETPPKSTLFPGVSNKVEQLFWLGGERLLVRETHAAGLKSVQLRDGKIEISEPAQLKKAALDQFRLFSTSQGLRPARIVDGVLQWLDAELQADDQIMLPQGEKLSDYLPVEDRVAWVLQDDGKALHRIELDDNGVAQVRDRVPIGGGLALRQDPLLGLVLIESKRLVVLREGLPLELQLIDFVDKRAAQGAGVKEINMHRVDAMDLDGDGRDEALVFDDSRHQLAVLQGGEKLTVSMAWPVFEDSKYPYDDETAPVVREPRTVVPLDIDGDGLRDLALLCHDRLLIYLAKENGAP